MGVSKGEKRENEAKKKSQTLIKMDLEGTLSLNYSYLPTVLGGVYANPAQKWPY